MICPHCGSPLKKAPKSNAEMERLAHGASWFDEFWALYPRKVAKASALKAWKKAATSEAIKDQIMAGLRQQLLTLREKDRQFIPHAATWLNGRRWEDELERPVERPLTEHERFLANRRAEVLRYQQVNGVKPS